MKPHQLSGSAIGVRLTAVPSVTQFVPGGDYLIYDMQLYVFSRQPIEKPPLSRRKAAKAATFSVENG
jgi:hypothetical protein